MLEMNLSIGKFEFEIKGAIGVYDYDSVTDEEKELLQTNVVASVSLKGNGLTYEVENDNFINADEYDQLLSDLQMVIDKPNFYTMLLSPGVQILSAPGKLKTKSITGIEVFPEEDEIMDMMSEEPLLEDYTNEPTIVIIFSLMDDNGYTPSSIQIVLDTDETKQFIEYLNKVRERTQTINIIY